MDPTQLTIYTLKNVVENAPFPIGVYTGHELRVILANDCMRHTWGKGNDVIGKLYTEILPELENQKIFDQLREVLTSKTPFEAKNTRVDLVKNGVLTPHYFNYNFTPVYDEQGNVFAVMNTAADVTDLHTARLQTIEAEERLRLAVQSADLGTFETREDTIQGSDRFYEIWGVEESRCTRSVLMQLIHDDDKPIRERAYESAATSGQLDYEVRIVPPGGATKWIRVKGTLLINTSEFKNVIGVVQDVTEQKLFAEKLRRQVKKRTRELKRSNEDLLQFAHVVSHDLKEPVRKIKMFNNLLTNELQPVLQEKSKAYLEKVQRASDRIFMLIDGILNYSQMNASGNPVEAVNINEIIDNIIEDLEVVITQKAASLTVGPIGTIEGSSILIHQLFYNLINNALKFSKGGEAPHIEITSTASEGHLEISVKDNGIGFNPIYSQKVFNAFERLNSKDLYEGTGLGLSLCKKIAERHQGTITAGGQLGVGAEFTVRLPKKQLDKI